MHGKRSLNKILTEKARKPVRTPYTVNSGIVIVGDWTLSEDKDGNLLATSKKTGNSVIVAFGEVDE